MILLHLSNYQEQLRLYWRFQEQHVAFQFSIVCHRVVAVVFHIFSYLTTPEEQLKIKRTINEVENDFSDDFHLINSNRHLKQLLNDSFTWFTSFVSGCVFLCFC